MTNKLLTKKDINNARNRWMFFEQIAFNYETMQSSSVVYSLGPCLEKIYVNDEEGLKKSLQTHFQFFNTQPWMGNIILSAALAIEEEGKTESLETVSSLKTSLMGPFAGLGDSIFFVLPKTILGALAAYMAVEGNPAGILICVFFGLFEVWLRTKMWSIGYDQGVRFVTSMQAKLNNITDAASVMGLMVVGSLIATMVSAKFILTINIGETATPIQNMFDKIMPNLLPALITVLVYLALGKKGMTSSRMVWLLIIVSCVFAAIGIM